MPNGENITLQIKPKNIRKLKTKFFKIFNVKASKFTLNNLTTLKNYDF